MKKLLVAFSLFAAVLTIGVIVLCFVDFDSPELGRTVLLKVSDATGLKVSALKLRLNLLRGLELSEVDVEGTLADGSTLKAHLSRLVLEHRVLPLLSGKVAFHRVLLESPRVELVGPPAGKRTPGKASASPRGREERSASPTAVESVTATGESTAFSLEVDEVRITDASLTAPGASMQGLDLNLDQIAFNPAALSPIHGLKAQGRLEIQETLLDGTKVSKLRGDFRTAGGHFEIPEATFSTVQGDFRATLACDFTTSPLTYKLQLAGDPLDMNATVGAGQGGGLGPARLQIEGAGFGTESRNVKAQGTLKLKPGKLPATAVLSGVEKALGKTTLVGAPYKATEARFRLANDRFTLEPFMLETEEAALGLEGWADLSGPLSLRLTVRTPRAGLQIKEVRPEVLDALTDDKGWVAIPMKVAGTSQKPSVAPDGAALTALARQGTERVVKEKAAGHVKGFLGKKFR